MQKTLAIHKPDAVAQQKIGAIVDRMERHV